MRRPRTALIVAVLIATALSASILQAQIFGRRRAAKSAQAAPPAQAFDYTAPSASRGARQLLRNGLDYLTNYNDPDRALGYLLEAEARAAELGPAEVRQLMEALDQATNMLAEDPAYAEQVKRIRSRPRLVARQGRPRPQNLNAAPGAQHGPGTALAQPQPYTAEPGVRLVNADGHDAQPSLPPAENLLPPVTQPAAELAQTVEAPAEPDLARTVEAPAEPDLAAQPGEPDLDAPSEPAGSAEPIGLTVLNDPADAPAAATPAADAGQAPSPLADPGEPFEPTPDAAPAPANVAEVPRPSGRTILMPSMPTRIPDPNADPYVSAVSPEAAAEASLPVLPPAADAASLAAPEPVASPEPPTQTFASPVPSPGPMPDPFAATPQPAPIDLVPVGGEPTPIDLVPVGGEPAPIDLVPVGEPADLTPPAMAPADPPETIELAPAMTPADATIDPAPAAVEPVPAPFEPMAPEPAPATADTSGTRPFEPQPIDAPPAPAADEFPSIDLSNARLGAPGPVSAPEPSPMANSLPVSPPPDNDLPALPRASGNAGAEAPGPLTLSYAGTAASDRTQLFREATSREIEVIARRQDDDLLQNPPPFGPDPELSENSGSRVNLPRAPSPTEARPIKPIFVPEEFVALGPREFVPNRKFWAGPATCHMPLYFQDAVLERYGQNVEQALGPHAGRFASYPLDDPTQTTQRMQLLQPLYSTGLFVLQIAAWPYNLVMNPPWEAEYDLGYYRPGDPIPPDTYYLPKTGVGPPLHGKRY